MMSDRTRQLIRQRAKRSRGGHGNAVSLPRLIVGKRHCRVLMMQNLLRLSLAIYKVVPMR